MTTSTPRHIVWDWNGTLLADTLLTLASANAALAALGVTDEVTLERWRELVDRPVRPTYDRLAGRALTDDDWDVVNRVWLACYKSGLSKIGLADDASAALDLVRRRGWTQSIVSLHRCGQLQRDVAAFGLTDRFLEVVGSDQSLWASGHDSKGELLAARLEALGLDPAQVLVIGDMTDDAVAAQYAGAEAVLVPTGDCSRARLEASGFPVADNLVAALGV
ncbi:MAG: HAD hydrolase-like protein [Propionibacteriaceae bacterium]|jgi:phosphoglycolate phosphatase-like HAD superfamily hydrolase|nr:HAD hydrolase-like protein [Propionibacteriaceae bacterium]